MKYVYLFIGIIIGAFVLFIPQMRADYVQVPDRLNQESQKSFGWGNIVTVIKDSQKNRSCYIVNGGNGAISISCIND